MGMYSSLVEEDIKVLDMEGLKNALSKFDEYFKAFLFEGGASFGFMNETKLIGYWYEDTVDFLEAITPFIHGQVVFEYETGDSRVIISFVGKKCKLAFEEREWEPTDTFSLLKFKEVCKQQEETWK